MKRSEMLLIIKKALVSWNGAFYDMCHEDYILERIEEAGMLPPHDGNGRVIFEDVQYIIDHYDWEPEDDN
jgi:hypothetical protein